MPKVIFLAMTIISCVPLYGQFHDNHWLLGYLGGENTPTNDSFGISILNFYEGELNISNDQHIDIFFQDNGNSFSDFDGNLLLYSNNLEIRNAEDESLNNGAFEDGGDSESILPQSSVYLPFDDFDKTYFVRMTYSDGSPRVGREITLYVVKDEENPRIVDIIDSVLVDSLTTGDLTACRHANGRDWWILLAAANKPSIYSILVDPFGVQSIDTIETSYELSSGLGQAKFSPDGTRFVRYNTVQIGEDDYVDIFNFNRVTGQVYNHRQFNISLGPLAGGTAISPSSQYLYVSHYDHIFQFDLWADNIFATLDTVATYDGYTEWGIFHSRFFMSELAPDGKIYVNNASGVKMHITAPLTPQLRFRLTP